ncbi:MAG TPA: hypothetical protein PKA10_15800 [Selenomonadales bacterium]|nr:hypothetical protein [Selenomonadales bacterium]
MSKFNRMLARMLRPSDSLPVVPSLHPYNFLLQLQPLLQQGRHALDDNPSRHVLTEVALTAYLMGMGFDYRPAKAIVDTWETDDALLNEGLLEK